MKAIISATTLMICLVFFSNIFAEEQKINISSKVGSRLSPVIEVVTFKLNKGVTTSEFRQLNNAVKAQHIAKQPGFISRKSAVDTDGEWLVIEHWQTLEDAEASMRSFTTSPATKQFMSKIDNTSMVMKHYMTTLSNKEKAVALLNSIETGDQTAVSYINAEEYTQHNLSVGDGLAGFGAVLQALPEGSAKVNVVRSFEEDDYVFTHTDYNFFGPKVGFDLFRFEDGLIVEHWDNLDVKVDRPNPSGHTQLDGTTKVSDIDKTEANKALVKCFIETILIEGEMEEIANFFDGDNYIQHNTAIADGLSGLGQALEAMAEQGIKMVYTENYKVLGEGNFVLSISEGQFGGVDTSFYDLFRVENGKIAEHWDIIEPILPKDQWQNSNGKFGNL